MVHITQHRRVVTTVTDSVRGLERTRVEETTTHTVLPDPPTQLNEDDDPPPSWWDRFGDYRPEN